MFNTLFCCISGPFRKVSTVGSYTVKLASLICHDTLMISITVPKEAFPNKAFHFDADWRLNLPSYYGPIISVSDSHSLNGSAATANYQN